MTNTKKEYFSLSKLVVRTEKLRQIALTGNFFKDFHQINSKQKFRQIKYVKLCVSQFENTDLFSLIVKSMFLLKKLLKVDFTNEIFL